MESIESTKYMCGAESHGASTTFANLISFFKKESAASSILWAVRQNDVFFRQLSDFQRTVSPAREQTVVFVYQDLGYPLAYVLKNSMPGMLASKSVVASVTRKGPDLEKRWAKLLTKRIQSE